jgi:hypothetical protein
MTQAAARWRDRDRPVALTSEDVERALCGLSDGDLLRVGRWLRCGAGACRAGSAGPTCCRKRCCGRSTARAVGRRGCRLLRFWREREVGNVLRGMEQDEASPGSECRPGWLRIGHCRAGIEG